MKFLDGDGLARVWAKIKQTFAYKTDIKSSDWDASEGEDGYIENRTHYEEIIGRDYKNTDADYAYVELPTGASPFDVKFAYYANETFESINDLKNRNLTLVFNGEPDSGELTSVTNHTTYWTAGDGTNDLVVYVISQSTIDGNTLDPGLYILVGMMGVTADSYELTKYDYVKKLDEKYIPNTIARTTDIPTTDQTYNSLSQNPQSGTAVAGAIANVTASIPTKTSDLTNDGIGGNPADPFITKTVDNLTNYYDKSDIDSMISVRLKIQVVDELPTQDIDPSTIYLVPSYGGSSSSDNTYEEYVYIIDEESSQVEGHWEMIGTSDVDLTDYMQKSNNLSDVDDRQTALNNLTNASVSHAGEYLKVDNAGNVTFGTVATQSQADWNQGDNTQVDYIKNKPTLATVATSGDYSDLSNVPTASVNGSTPDALESISVVKADRTITHQKFHDTTITLNNTDVVVAVPFVDQNFTDPASKNAVSVAAVNGALSEKLNTSAFLEFEKNVILRGGEIQGNGSSELIPKTTVNHVNLWASTTTTTYIIKQDPGEKENYWAALDVDGITDLYISGSAEKFRMCLTDGTSSYTSAQDIIDFIDSIVTPKTGQGATDMLSLTCSWTSNQAVSTLDNYHITNTNNNKILLMYFGLSNSSLVITTEGLEPAFLSTIDSSSINAVQSRTLYTRLAGIDAAIPTKTSDLINDGEDGGSSADPFVKVSDLDNNVFVVCEDDQHTTSLKTKQGYHSGSSTMSVVGDDSFANSSYNATLDGDFSFLSSSKNGTLSGVKSFVSASEYFNVYGTSVNSAVLASEYAYISSASGSTAKYNSIISSTYVGVGAYGSAATSGESGTNNVFLGVKGNGGGTELKGSTGLMAGSDGLFKIMKSSSSSSVISSKSPYSLEIYSNESSVFASSNGGGTYIGSTVSSGDSTEHGLSVISSYVSGCTFTGSYNSAIASSLSGTPFSSSSSEKNFIAALTCSGHSINGNNNILGASSNQASITGNGNVILSNNSSGVNITGNSNTTLSANSGCNIYGYRNILGASNGCAIGTSSTDASDSIIFASNSLTEEGQYNAILSSYGAGTGSSSNFCSIISVDGSNVYGSYSSIIASSGGNSIAATSVYSSIISGASNEISGTYDTIISSTSSEITSSGDYNAIIAGSSSEISGSASCTVVIGPGITATESNTLYVRDLKVVGNLKVDGVASGIKKPISTSSCTPNTYYCPTNAATAGSIIFDDTNNTGNYNYSFSGYFTNASSSQMTQMPSTTSSNVAITWYGDTGLEAGEKYMFVATKVSGISYVGVVTKLS